MESWMTVWKMLKRFSAFDGRRLYWTIQIWESSVENWVLNADYCTGGLISLGLFSFTWVRSIHHFDCRKSVQKFVVSQELFSKMFVSYVLGILWNHMAIMYLFRSFILKIFYETLICEFRNLRSSAIKMTDRLYPCETIEPLSRFTWPHIIKCAVLFVAG